MTAPDDKAFSLDGDLTAAQVAAIHRQARPACRKGQIPARIDLSRVSRTDSSALALLLEWQACARQQNRSVEFANPPESLQVLAGLSQVGDLLGWRERAAQDPAPDQNRNESRNDSNDDSKDDFKDTQ